MRNKVLEAKVRNTGYEKYHDWDLKCCKMC